MTSETTDYVAEAVRLAQSNASGVQSYRWPKTVAVSPRRHRQGVGRRVVSAWTETSCGTPHGLGCGAEAGEPCKPDCPAPASTCDCPTHRARADEGQP